jgi:hypothetical protein
VSKGKRLGHTATITGIVLLVLLAGCALPPGGGPEPFSAELMKDGRVFLTVDFEQGKTLRYKFVSDRTITLDWDPGAAASKDRVQEQSECLETVVAYTPVEVDRYGPSTIRAVVESVQATRRGGPGARVYGPDAVETAQGKSFTLKVDPRGRVVEASSLAVLIQEMGQKAFQADTARGRIKEPDMIGDFVAGQWFLWDAVASIEQPAQGVAVGQTWHSQLSVPTPMVMREARDVTYRLDEVRQMENGLVAVIRSSQTLAQAAPSDWPVPYAGRFQVQGTFGFLGGYQPLSLAGRGAEWFDVEAGQIRRSEQTYTMEVKCALPPVATLLLSAQGRSREGSMPAPHITIEQTLTMELMDRETRNPNIEARDKSE